MMFAVITPALIELIIVLVLFVGIIAAWIVLPSTPTEAIAPGETAHVAAVTAQPSI
jgi:hypothetical protein